MTHPSTIRLQGPRVLLREARPEDVAARLALGNDPAIQAMYGTDPTQVRPITPEAAEAWVQDKIDTPHSWVIEAEGQLLGAVRLHTVNRVDSRASIAIGLLSQETLGKGYGTEAMRLVATHAFETMGLHRLSCRVLANNPRAIAAYKKVGFVEEGRERESVRTGDGWQDDILMGLLASDLRAG